MMRGSTEPAGQGGATRGPSLKSRAVALLSRREHSRLELSRKLSRYSDDPQAIDAVLQDLQREGWLSDQRFAQSLVHRQAPRHGAARIVQALRQHGLDDDSVRDVADALRDTELARARDIWRRKFGAQPADAKEYARQMRFLAYRGFSPGILRQILAQPDGIDGIDD